MSEQAKLFYGNPEKNKRKHGRSLSGYDRFKEDIRAMLEAFEPLEGKVKGEMMTKDNKSHNIKGLQGPMPATARAGVLIAQPSQVWLSKRQETGK